MTESGEFLPLFLEEAAGRLDVILEALDEGAVRTPAELETLMREAHTLKGSSGIVGLGEIEQIAHAMEDLLVDAHAAEGGLDDESCETVRRLAGAIRRRLDDLAAPAAADAQRQNGASPPAAGDGVRVSPEKIDRLLDMVGETVLQQRRVLSSLDGDGRVDYELAAELELTQQMLEDLQDSALQIRILPISTIVRPLRRAVRQLSDAHGKLAELVVEGLDAELDRTLLEGLLDSLTHIVRNAVAHGIENADDRRAAGKPPKGTVTLSAVQREHGVEVTVRDDGRGVAPELLARAGGGRALAELLAQPGLSTAAEVTELSGRGVGMDAVLRYVGALGGDVTVESTPGVGTEIRLRLPQTLTLLDVLLVARGRSVFGLPLGSVREVGMHDTQALCGEPRLALEGIGMVSYRDLADILALDAPALPERPQTVIVGDAERHVAVACDRLVGQEQVVVKSLALPGVAADGYIGAAILGDGQIALVLDPHLLTQPRHAPVRRRVVAVEERALAPKALVVEDSFTVRELQRSILEAAGYRVTTARDGAEALRRLDAEQDVSIVITDLEMPELDGFGLIESVRGDERRSALPIVIVSSLEDDDARRRAGAVGADAFVVKRAYDQSALLETVEQLVGR